MAQLLEAALVAVVLDGLGEMSAGPVVEARSHAGPDYNNEGRQIKV